MEGRGITRSASSGWRRPAQNAWTRGQSGRGTTKGRASLAMRTRWTSSRSGVQQLLIATAANEEEQLLSM